MQTEMFPDIFPLKLIPSRDEHHETYLAVKQRVTACFNTYTGDDFPGTMPVTFSRQHLRSLQDPSEYKYFISEKTDGLRYMMFIGAGSVPGSGVFLIDRSFTIYQITEYMESNTDLRPYLAPHRDTLLDGEMVRGPGFQVAQ